jgi:hypothetical protein
MKLWDRFVNHDKPQGNKHLPESLLRFAHEFKDQLAIDSLRPEFWKFLLNLKQYNRISNMVIKSVMAVIPMEKSGSPKIKSPQKSPRTPAGKRGVPVPSAITKVDEGAYCLCRSVWCNGMVACANEDCKVEWYHLSCINMTQKPIGRWVCPRYGVCTEGLMVGVTLCHDCKFVNALPLLDVRQSEHGMGLGGSLALSIS